MQHVLGLRLLGGSKVFARRTPATPLQLNDVLQAGIPARALIAFKAATEFTVAELSHFLGVSAKSVARYIDAPAKRLPPAPSDRLYRSAKMVDLAAEVLGGKRNALAWLRSAQPGLGKRRPLDLLATDAGARQVEDELLRIEHGFLA